MEAEFAIRSATPSCLVLGETSNQRAHFTVLRSGPDSIGNRRQIIFNNERGHMTFDPRDELWEVTFETYYDSYYNEQLSDFLINRWQRVDEGTKVLSAVTASGSAVSGWALWSQPGFHITWAILAGLAALLTITHAALAVPGRIKDQTELKRRFAGLRTDLETFRYRMRVDPDFSVEDFTKEFVAYRNRYSDNIQLLKNDLLLTRRLTQKAQSELNNFLKDEISSN